MQIKVIDNRTSLSKKLEDLVDKVEGIKEEIGYLTAQSLVINSPVDTGAFMDSYNANEGRSRGGGRSSNGRPKKQSWETFASSALARISAQIAGIGSSNETTVSNNAPHAKIVEKKYMPFAITRARSKVIVAEAIKRAGF